MCDRFLYDKVETLRVIKDCIEGLPKSICECLSILVYSRSSSPAQNTASKLLSPIDRYHNAFCRLSSASRCRCSVATGSHCTVLEFCYTLNTIACIRCTISMRSKDILALFKQPIACSTLGWSGLRARGSTDDAL